MAERPKQRRGFLEWLLSPQWFMPTAIWVVRTYARLFRGLRITGLENVPQGVGLVVACNHESSWDPPIVGVSINRKLEFMAKKELFAKPFSRAIMRGLRAFPVDREGQDIGAIKEALRRLKEGRAIGVFVQGTRNAGDAAALDGAAYLAQRAGTQLLPAAIWRENGKFRVAFGLPLAAAGRTRDDASELTRAVMLEIAALLPAHGERDGVSAADKTPR
jgi:1-acyl-sn-glycerol-3-phosphate acyltransferase